MVSRTKIEIIISWIVLFTYLFMHQIFFKSNIYFLLSIISILSNLFGSIILIKLPKTEYSKKIFYLMFSISIMFQFLYSGSSGLNQLGLILLSTCPILLYLFLFSFINSTNKNLKEKINFYFRANMFVVSIFFSTKYLL